jgi:SAM-dependent methyltransferase
MELRDKFSQIYRKNLFGGSASRSGEGSSLDQTRWIRKAIPEVVRECRIQTFLDAPCGDWHWMRRTRLNVPRYIGVDIVPELIWDNRAKYARSGVEFRCLDIAGDLLPAADLILSRDCLVHLSYADTFRVLANFKQSGARYLLATTFTRHANEDLGPLFWRPLNLQLPPFNFGEPLRMLDEHCSENGGEFADKSLGLWLLADIDLSGAERS